MIDQWSGILTPFHHSSPSHLFLPTHLDSLQKWLQEFLPSLCVPLWFELAVYQEETLGGEGERPWIWAQSCELFWSTKFCSLGAWGGRGLSASTLTLSELQDKKPKLASLRMRDHGEMNLAYDQTQPPASEGGKTGHQTLPSWLLTHG